VDVVTQAYYPGRPPLREQAAFAALSADQRQRLATKFNQDVAAARQLRPLRTD
jgi:hypothetical protein